MFAGGSRAVGYRRQDIRRKRKVDVAAVANRQGVGRGRCQRDNDLIGSHGVDRGDILENRDSLSGQGCSVVERGGIEDGEGRIQCPGFHHKETEMVRIGRIGNTADDVLELDDDLAVRQVGVPGLFE